MLGNVRWSSRTKNEFCVGLVREAEQREREEEQRHEREQREVRDHRREVRAAVGEELREHGSPAAAPGGRRCRRRGHDPQYAPAPWTLPRRSPT